MYHVPLMVGREGFLPVGDAATRTRHLGGPRTLKRRRYGWRRGGWRSQPANIQRANAARLLCSVKWIYINKNRGSMSGLVASYISPYPGEEDLGRLGPRLTRAPLLLRTRASVAPSGNRVWHSLRTPVSPHSESRAGRRQGPCRTRTKRCKDRNGSSRFGSVGRAPACGPQGPGFDPAGGT